VADIVEINSPIPKVVNKYMQVENSNKNKKEDFDLGW
jgi:hypothetical protein